MSDLRRATPPEQRAWVVGPYKDEWVIICHRATRTEARWVACHIDLWNMEYTDMRAVRAPYLDGLAPTRELLLANGWPEEWEGEPLDLDAYAGDCGCALCKEAR